MQDPLKEPGWRRQEGGLAKEKHGKNAENRSGRVTKAGRIEVYIHHDGKQAAMVELKCETDFVARNDEFKQVAKDIAVHILEARNPKFRGREDMPAADLEAKRAAFVEERRAAREHPREAGRRSSGPLVRRERRVARSSRSSRTMPRRSARSSPS
ncbi:MAG: hypothetical protein U0794_04795 [Isosphaeraceae bacterium]